MVLYMKSLSMSRFVFGALYMQHIVAFLYFSRVISTDKISAQLSMYLDFSGRYLYCKDSLMYKTTPPPFYSISSKIKYHTLLCRKYQLSLSLSPDSERAMTSNLNSRAVMLSFNLIKLLARLLQLKCINEN